MRSAWARRFREVPWRQLQAAAAPYGGVTAFLGGVLWDAATLVRVDRLADNLLLGGYVAVLGALLVLERRLEQEPERWPWLSPRAGWVSYAGQFLFGGLLSASVVFYTRSASWGPTLAYVIVLAALLVANEFAHAWFHRTWIRVALYGFATFNWLLFVVPVTTGHLGPGMLPVAALLASGLALGVAWLGDAGLPNDQRRDRLTRQGGALCALFAALLTADLAGVIPPVPLAALEIGIFHGVEPRVEPAPGRRATRYWLTYEAPRWYEPFRDDDRVFRWREGEKAHCFTAIFVPVGMQLRAFHVWERWDEARGWVQTNRIQVTSTAKGSPDGEGRWLGWRTWSFKAALAEGDWRCRLETEAGREIARVGFSVVQARGSGAYVERAWD